MSNNLNKTLLFLISVLLISGCIPLKKVTYLQPEKRAEETGNIPVQIPEIIIKPFDELFVNITSVTDLEGEGINTNPLTTGGGSLAQSDITTVSYPVDKDGFVLLPVVGRVKAAGLSPEGLSATLTNQLGSYMEQPFVSVKLLNKTVTIIGEVTAPGVYPYAGSKFTLFGALAMAGDISTYGNRESVLIVREGEAEVSKRYLDLTNDDIIPSEYMYIKPNDIIYVPSLKKKYWGMRASPFNVIISVISTYMLIYGFTAQ
jgi:polysaccharide export outer membrane protein